MKHLVFQYWTIWGAVELQGVHLSPSLRGAKQSKTRFEKEWGHYDAKAFIVSQADVEAQCLTNQQIKTMHANLAMKKKPPTMLM